MYRRIAIAATALAVLSAPAKAKRIEKAVKTYVKTNVYIYAGYDEKCRPTVGTVKLLEPPKNGILATNQTEVTIQSARGNEQLLSRCRGTAIKGFSVDYISNAGYIGTDTFKIEVRYGKRRAEVDTFFVVVSP